MILANYGRFGAAPSLQGLAGTAEIVKLQQSLVNLAASTNKPQLNPGRTDGVLDDATMACVASAFSYAANELPGWLATPLNLALIGGSGTSTAKSYVGSYAAQLSVAFNAAAVKYKSSSVPAPTAPIATATPWYKTPWGIAGIIVGGLIVLKFVLAPRQAAQ